MQQVLRKRLQTAALYLLTWTLAALFFFSQELTQRLALHDATPPWRFLVSWLLGLYICAGLAPGILWLGRCYPIERRNWVRRTALHGAASVVFAVLNLGLASLELPYLHVLPPGVQGFAGTFALLLIISFHGAVLTYWVVLGVQSGLRYYRRFQERQREALQLGLRAAELNAQLTNAQLSALKVQLQPHFLFNTLNAIMVLVRQQRTAEAEEMLVRLSDLLRCVLEDVDAQEVPLRRELEYVGLYLSIEEVRFQDRLRVEIDAEPGVLDALVPHIALQPLVENAIRHGIGKRLAAGRIIIRARRTAHRLEILVRDDGPGFSPGEASEGSGIGLRNTRARLQQLYGADAELLTSNEERGGAVVTIAVPFRGASALVTGTEAMALHATPDSDR